MHNCGSESSRTVDIPLGCANSCLSTPALIARLNWLSKVAPGETLALFASMYFLRAERLYIALAKA